MRHRTGLLTLALCAAVAAPQGYAMAQTQAAPAASTTAAQPIPAEIRQALDRMGTALRALTSFQVKAEVTTEDVLENGQKLQSSAPMSFLVRRPDRLAITIDTPHKQRRIFYDGRQLTVFGPKNGYYGSIAAPPTIAGMIKVANDRFGLETPLADLFEWGTTAFPVERIKGALYAGSDLIGGLTCEHYAFHQDEADWQLWIDKASALPCKLVITDTVDPALPQTIAVLQWTPNVQVSDSQFTFTPPADARRIEVGQVATAATGAPK
ncbi:hypothetical protein SAMN06295912_11072 [Sphingomonas laterariae]|uniref:Outer membrane lipoprotein-sorting protein n=1 Tax=Edaphosphingomonas laterariae TaxID=861865 RepID=A0A239FWW8_9SPHN|nr:DUF2092 domain-containing protein [Sphingomonas laterariae]SNS61225.1 hypothetical protein SAMN06295912_11072 [Sphingomonas laterariae]